jgi:predicted TIM-barrel fold metal-dependent hydrolase
VNEWMNWLISVDDHVIEPPTVWQDRIPARYRDDAPRWISDDIGEAWLYDGKRLPQTGLAAVSGTPRDTWNPAPLSFGNLRKAYFDPKPRLEDMDRDGVVASLCFPTFPRFCGQTFYEAQNRDLGLLCVLAYNDWMIDEWSGSAPGRFIPLILIPLWDPKAAALEIERCAAKGGKAIAFSENPSKLGLPSVHDADRYWDPVFAAAQETGMPMCTHIGSSSALPVTSPDAPMILSITLSGLNSQSTLVDWLYSGVLLRFPKLKLVLSEGGIAFMPGALERVARDLDRQGPWARKSNFSGDLIKGDMAAEQSRSRPDDIDIYDFDPMEIFHRQIYGCMIPDYEGWEYLDTLGTDNVMLETDYPHSDSSWPSSMEQVHHHLGHLDEQARYNIQLGTACRVFNLPRPTTFPQVTVGAS